MPRRILKPFTVEIRSTGRRKPAVSQMALDDQPRVERPAMPPAAAPHSTSFIHNKSGRILAALDVLPPPSEPAPRPKRQRASRMAAEAQQPATAPEMPEAAPQPTTASLEPVSPPSPPEAAEAAPAPRNGRPRLLRAEFPRGQRWRARLPVAVHRKRLSAAP